MDFYTLHFDGSCPKNPGDKASYGYTIHHSAELVKEGNGGLVGDGLDNNLAEFYGLYKGLCYLKGLVKKGSIVSVKGDSALVIKILKKKWKLRKDRSFYEFAKRSLDLTTEMRKKGADVSFTWIPRNLNQVCDKLSKKI
jgi:ribonuclease HI